MSIRQGNKLIAGLPDISTKADKETTYTKEEVDNLINNASPNIQGGEYIDVIEPKGDTLYEYDIFDLVLSQYNMTTCHNIILKTNTFDYTGISMTDFISIKESRSGDLYGQKLPESFEQYLIPAYKQDGSQYTVNDIITQEYFDALNSTFDTPFESVSEMLSYASYDNADSNALVYILKFEQEGTSFLIATYPDKNGDYIHLVAGMYDITPINIIEQEASNALIVDLNDKALEIIENAGSDISTNGWNIFDHKFSDHLLNDPSWVRSDTYSWQDGGIYFTAYEELEKENSDRVEDVVSTETWYAFYHELDDDFLSAYENVYETVYTNKEQPEFGDDFVVITGDEESGYVFTDYPYTCSSFNEETQTIGLYCKAKDEDFTMASTYTYAPERNIVITSETKGNTSSDTIGDVTITYYKSVNGLKICLPDQSDAIEQLYANTGVAWYYIIDTENKRFKLPRKVSETLDLNTVAVVGNGNDIYWSFSKTTQNNKTLAVSAHSLGVDGVIYQIDSGANVGLTTDPTKSGMIADLSSIGYKEVTEQTYLYFFMGDTLRDARIIDVNAVVENQTTVTNELDALKNLLASIDYVVESKVATDEDPTWYRVYKSGWVEQGGISVEVSAAYLTINLLKNYSSTNYSLVTTAKHDGTDVAYDSHVGGVTTSSFNIYSKEAVAHPVYWEAKGQGAQ